MSIYEIQSDRDIEAIIPQGKGGALARQVVLENGVLVADIFDYDRSHFTVLPNQQIFDNHPEDTNFALLRRLCGLLDSKTAHVSSLIAGFRIKSGGVTREVILNTDNQGK